MLQLHVRSGSLPVAAGVILMDAVVQGSSQPCLPWMDDRDCTAPVNNTHVCSDSANFPGWRKCIVLLVPFFIKCR